MTFHAGDLHGGVGALLLVYGLLPVAVLAPRSRRLYFCLT
jgi:hypothetical protein